MLTVSKTNKQNKQTNKEKKRTKIHFFFYRRKYKPKADASYLRATCQSHNAFIADPACAWATWVPTRLLFFLFPLSFKCCYFLRVFQSVMVCCGNTFLLFFLPHLRMKKKKKKKKKKNGSLNSFRPQ